MPEPELLSPDSRLAGSRQHWPRAAAILRRGSCQTRQPALTHAHLLRHFSACREAQEEGEYAEAFWLCAQCIKSMEELGEGLRVGQEVGAAAAWLAGWLAGAAGRPATGSSTLAAALWQQQCGTAEHSVACLLTARLASLPNPRRPSPPRPPHPNPPPQLTVTINRLYAETTQRLETALAAVCADFRPSHYTKVLEGHMFLGNVGQVSRVGGALSFALCCWWLGGLPAGLHGHLLPTAAGCAK